MLQIRIRLVVLLLTITISLVLAIVKWAFSTELEWNLVGFTLAIGFIGSTLFAVGELENVLRREASLLDAAARARLTSELTEIAKEYKNVDAKGDGLFLDFTYQLVARLKRELSLAASGEININEQDRLTTYVHRIAHEITTSLDATVIWNDDTLLRDRRKLEYKRACKNARERGASIRRIYIFDSEEEAINAEVLASAGEDDGMGAEVRWCLKDEWKAGISEARDFGIFDRKRLWIYKGRRSDNDRSAKISIDPEQIRAFQRMFDANWSQANEFEFEREL